MVPTSEISFVFCPVKLPSTEIAAILSRLCTVEELIMSRTRDAMTFADSFIALLNGTGKLPGRTPREGEFGSNERSSNSNVTELIPSFNTMV